MNAFLTVLTQSLIALVFAVVVQAEPLTERRIPENGYIFKHSTECSISAQAAREVQTAKFPEPLYWINVLTQKELSGWVAETLKVKHESPQLLRIKDGKAVQVWNHYEIRRENFLPAEPK